MFADWLADLFLVLLFISISCVKGYVCCISCYSNVLCSFAMFNSHSTKVMFACTAFAIKKKEFLDLYSVPPSGPVSRDSQRPTHKAELVIANFAEGNCPCVSM